MEKLGIAVLTEEPENEEAHRGCSLNLGIEGECSLAICEPDLVGLVDHRGEIWILFPAAHLGKGKGKLEKKKKKLYQFGIYFE